MLKYIFSFVFFLPSIFLIAQTEKIETDRPGRTNTADITPNNWLQSETGLQKQTFRFQPVLKDLYFQSPAFLIKYGISNRFEVRLLSEFAHIKEENVTINSIYNGFINTQIGGKFNFLKQIGLIPKTSILAHYRFNILNSNAKGRDTINGGNISLAMQHKISENFLVASNIGVDKLSWQYKPAYFFSVSPKFNFAENWQAFIEVYGNFWKRRFPETFIDSGISYFINNNFKVDLSAGIRVSKDKYSSIKFFGIGASYRFKTSNEN